jgi:hypothetical protein
VLGSVPGKIAIMFVGVAGFGQWVWPRTNSRPLISTRGTYTWNRLHSEEFPLARRPTRKENTSGMIVVVEELMSIVEDGPCHLRSKWWERRKFVDEEQKVNTPSEIRVSSIVQQRRGGP